MTIRSLNRNGMTAVEVLAATVLASLMLGSVMGVLGGLTRQQRTLLAATDLPSWHQQLSDQLLWDLENSREVVASQAGVRLVGFAGRDFTNGKAAGRATAVEYFLLDMGNDRYLVRREEHLDARTNDNWRIELVCRSAQKFDFGMTTIQQASTGTPHLNQPDRVQSLPNRVAVRIYDSTSGLPSFDRQFILR